MTRLSVVLATDVYDTVRPVVAALQRQRLAAEIELVIVLPASAQGGVPREELHGVWPHSGRRGGLHGGARRGPGRRHPRRIGPDRLHRRDPHVRRRGLGRSAPGPVRRTVDRCRAGDRQRQSNQCRELGGLPLRLCPLGTFAIRRRDVGPPRVTILAHRRSALLALGDRLPDALDPHQEVMWPLLWGSGHRALFAPAARITHVNVGRPGWLLQEKFCSGVLLGMGRSHRWPLWRRLVYLLASPLIPIVLLARVARDARPPVPARLPAGTIPALVLCALAKTLGEVVGYLGVVQPARAAQLTRMEIHKVKNTPARTPPAPGSRRSVPSECRRSDDGDVRQMQRPVSRPARETE